MLFENENKIICGIDEAGRGALAGELVIAACVFYELPSKNLADSKILKEKQREEIFNEITSKCDYLTIYFRNTIIDTIGLSACFVRALNIFKMHFKECDFIFDGNTNYGVNGIKTIIKADAKIPQVSAASIIAKVSRDRSMRAWGKIYPKFGYEIHKGYGTKAHIQALNKYGANELTRKSFKIKKQDNLLF